MIHAEHGQAVFAYIASVLDEFAPSAGYRAVFDKALGLVRRDAEAAAMFPPIDLPMAVGDLLGRSDEERHVAAAASTCLWAGADLMDDVADGQLCGEWNGDSGRLLALVSTNLLSTMPHLLLAALRDADGVVAGRYSRAVSEALFSMSEGQSRDFESGSAVLSPEQYISLVRYKTGAEFALFACTPAILAGADSEAVGAWVDFGLAYGTMLQVFNDTVSTIAEGPRNDLLAGKRSLPVLHALANTSGQSHLDYENDLDMAARGDHSAVTRAIEAMVRAGAVQFSFSQVELYRYRATRALPVKLTDMDATHPMRQLLSACSVI